MVLLAVVVVASLVGAVEPWSLPTAAHPLRGHVGSRTCRTALAVRVQPPAVSVRGRTAVCLGMTEAGHTHDESCGPACSQEPGAVLMEKLGAIDSSDDRRAMLRGNFQQCDDAAMQFLGTKLQAGEAGNWQALLLDLQQLMEERLEAGKDLLMLLLASGEINVLDRKIVEKVKNGECDPSFLNVLQINLQDAEENASAEDGDQRLQVLVHIYTRVQEELEKKAKPAVGLLHKLLRMIDEPDIRINVLEHNLKPKPEDDRAMVVVDGKMTLDPGSLVPPMDLSAAIVEYMDRVRGIDQMDAGFTEDDVAQTFEDCRVIAKEARMQVERFYDKEQLDTFTESLTPVFEPIMGTLANYRRP